MPSSSAQQSDSKRNQLDGQFEHLSVRIDQMLNGLNCHTIWSRFDRADIRQNVLLQLWQDGSWHSNSKLNSARLRKIIRGHTAKLIRYHLAAKRSVQREAKDATEKHCLARQREVDSELSQQVEQLIHRFDSRTQQILRLRISGHTFSQIQSQLKTTCSHVSRRYWKAIQHIRHQLQRAHKNPTETDTSYKE